jgi:hypothetical protein
MQITTSSVAIRTTPRTHINNMELHIIITSHIKHDNYD